MISKFNGTCFYCKRPTKAGVDTYNLDEKISYHATCRDNVDAMDDATAGDDARAIADKLGFE